MSWNYTNKPREEWDYRIWVQYYLENGATGELAEAMAKARMRESKDADCS